MSIGRLRSRPRQVVVGTGRFFCPSCQTERDYAEKSTVRDYSLFYLIPLGGSKPTGEVVIECQECHRAYTTAVFSLPENTVGAQAKQRDHSPEAAKHGDRPWRRPKWWQLWRMFNRLLQAPTSKKHDPPPASDLVLAADQGLITPEAASRAEQHLQQGWNCRAKNDFEGALASFDQAIALNPSLAYAFYARGVVHAILARHQPALGDLERAIALRPNYAEAIVERGLVQLRLGNFSKALADYEEAIAIDPAYSIAYQNRGALFAEQGKLPEALPSFGLALRLQPREAAHYFNHGSVCLKMKNYPRALTDFETFLHLDPQNALAKRAEEYVDWLRHRVQGERQGWSIREVMWSEFVHVPLNVTVAELISRVQKAKAFHVVAQLPDGQKAIGSVYGAYGLRHRLTEIADLVGRHVLELRLDQILDFWHPCQPVDPSTPKDRAYQISEQCGGRTLVVDGSRIIGVLETRSDYRYPTLPTVLFGKSIVFGRENRVTGSHHQWECHACHETFAYYAPVVEQGALSDVACPQCRTSPTHKWVEARMRPGNWSQAGFLGENEELATVIAEDAQTLERLDLSHDQIATALDTLLDIASAEYEPYFTASIERMVKQSAGAPVPEPQSPLAHSIDEIEALLLQGQLPLESVGVVEGDYQVFLEGYFGYQFCPWTISRRPWSSDMPGAPMRIEMINERVNIVHVPSVTIACRSNLTYRYADRDFLIINRKAKSYLKGPGLIVHLIRDHRFFEGKESRYRIDPEHAGRVLGLI